MPYIYCESCGAGHYSNVLSCPACGASIRRVARTHGMVRRMRMRAAQPPIDVEDEVRETLYGWHSGCVARWSGEEAAASAASSPRLL
jgi:hypothetical protein